MVFLMSKLLGWLATPSSAILLAAAAGLVLMCTRYRRIGRQVVTGSALALMLAGVLPLGTVLLRPLEDRFPIPFSDSVDGIVVLGGMISPELSLARGQPALNDAAERLVAAAALAIRNPKARIVLSGGNARLAFARSTEADAAVEVLTSLGVARERILLERESRTTAENAVLSRRLVEPRAGERWLLVTSAAHMPRAMGVFRRAGFAVRAYPVDYRTPRGWTDPFAGIGTIRGLGLLDGAAHEWIGLLAYWIAGYSADLFPAP